MTMVYLVDLLSEISHGAQIFEPTGPSDIEKFQEMVCLLRTAERDELIYGLETGIEQMCLAHMMLGARPLINLAKVGGLTPAGRAVLAAVNDETGYP